MKNKKITLTILLLSSLIIVLAAVCIIYHYQNEKTEIIITTEEIEFERKVNAEDNLTDDEIINMLFEEKVLNEVCNKREIKIEDSVMNRINSKLQEKPTEADLKAIESWGMTETEFHEYAYEMYVNSEKRSILLSQMVDEIDNNNLKIKNRKLKKRVDDFNKNRASMSLVDVFKTLEGLYDEYVEILKSDYVVKVE